MITVISKIVPAGGFAVVDLVNVGGSEVLMRVVSHGADSSVVRPVGSFVVTWIGSVQPANMAVGDIWEETSV